MNTTIAIDKRTKLKAEKRAKNEGLSISTIVRIFLNDYATGKINIGTQITQLTENGFTPEFEDEILRAGEEAELGKNVTKPMSIKKAIEYLNSF